MVARLPFSVRTRADPTGASAVRFGSPVVYASDSILGSRYFCTAPVTGGNRCCISGNLPSPCYLLDCKVGSPDTVCRKLPPGTEERLGVYGCASTVAALYSRTREVVGQFLQTRRTFHLGRTPRVDCDSLGNNYRHSTIPQDLR